MSLYLLYLENNRIFLNAGRSKENFFFCESHCYPGKPLNHSSLSFFKQLSGTAFPHHQYNSVTLSTENTSAVQTEITTFTGLGFFCTSNIDFRLSEAEVIQKRKHSTHYKILTQLFQRY